MTIIKIILPLAAQKEWPPYQMDVKLFFLYGYLEENIYMTIPPSVNVNGFKNPICKLQIPLYGLKWSSHAWYFKLSRQLIDGGFNMSATDNSLFIKQINYEIVIIVVYVDDINIIGDNQKVIINTKSILKRHFEIRYLGKSRYFLGLKVLYSNKKNISLSKKVCSRPS